MSFSWAWGDVAAWPRSLQLHARPQHCPSSPASAGDHGHPHLAPDGVPSHRNREPGRLRDRQQASPRHRPMDDGVPGDAGSRSSPPPTPPAERQTSPTPWHRSPSTKGGDAGAEATRIQASAEARKQKTQRQRSLIPSPPPYLSQEDRNHHEPTKLPQQRKCPCPGLEPGRILQGLITKRRSKSLPPSTATAIRAAPSDEGFSTAPDRKPAVSIAVGRPQIVDEGPGAGSGGAGAGGGLGSGPVSGGCGSGGSVIQSFSIKEANSTKFVVCRGPIRVFADFWAAESADRSGRQEVSARVYQCAAVAAPGALAA